MVSLILTFIASFVAMEGVAWLTHRYVMHGPLWFLHRDHHEPHEGTVVEKNDLFFVFFALPGILLIYFGVEGPHTYALAAGTGITAYGTAYFLVHEVLIHQRVKLFSKTKNPYFAALVSAHGRHHKCTERDGAECFGMLVVPFRFYQRAWHLWCERRAQYAAKR